MSSRLRKAYVAANCPDEANPRTEGAPKRSDGGLLIRMFDVKATRTNSDERELIPTDI
jgi:hypothetical protein